MNVWVVTAGYNYDSGLYMDIFAKREDADGEAKRLQEEDNYEWVDVDEMPVK